LDECGKYDIINIDSVIGRIAHQRICKGALLPQSKFRKL